MLDPSDITWELSADAWRFVQAQPRQFQDHYSDIKGAFKVDVCRYINAVGGCDQKAIGISPLGGTDGGGKVFKVRVAVPGGGKSGGLRALVVAYCASRRVVVASVVVRRDAG